ncbi:MAG: putative cytochrome with 4 heme binding site [uncultured bacterium]|nr:MAG: putative cytochrome with 4 heme binding site [uncultured bacterium]
MKRIILIIAACFFLFGGLGLANEKSRAYLNSHIKYEFKKPTGINTSTIDPFSGLKTVPYSDPVYLSEGTLSLVDRLKYLKQSPCSTCHQGAVIDKNSLKDDQNPHARISLHHGHLNKMTCATCHEPTSVDRLKLMGGQAPINEAPKLCGTCHSTQYKDWIHGAHGKRVGSWTGKRVVYSCTQCHDPHNPAFKVRFPVARPKLNRFEKN